MKEFNTTAVCIPEKHYMVDISERVREIKKLVDAGKYFTMNRARQYGKTTTLNELRKYLMSEYTVLSLDFQGIGNAGFSTEQSFVKSFCRLLRREFRMDLEVDEKVKESIESLFRRSENNTDFGDLFDVFLDWCDVSAKPIVLIIDEVDHAANNQVFLDFLAQLRESYINRDTKRVKTFWSVILAGVTDVRHLKSKIRPDEYHKENSPWNIASDFDFFQLDTGYMLSCNFNKKKEPGVKRVQIGDKVLFEGTV